MTNPFEPPAVRVGAESSLAPGDFDIGVAFSAGWKALTTHGWVWLAATLVAGVVGLFSFAACVIPAFVVIPTLMWGTTRFTMDAVEGEPELNTVFAGFSRLGEVWGSMFGVGVLYFLLALPGFVASMMIQLGPSLMDNQDEPAVQALVLVANLIGTVVNRAWDLVVFSRFLPALFLVVDRGMSPLDAFTESWRLTSGCWGKLIVFSFAAMLVPFIGLLACCVGIIPAAFVVSAAQVSVYRQLVGRS